jgi:hypothetical protein
VIAYENSDTFELKNEFVLNENGAPLPKGFDLKTYQNYFSVYDIFQGYLGDCYLIGTIMGLTKNKELLSHVIPADNALVENIKNGAYHFRLWKLGKWYDVVVDDYLPTINNRLILTRNLTYKNEFWISLFEKAIAK